MGLLILRTLWHTMRHSLVVLGAVLLFFVFAMAGAAMALRTGQTRGMGLFLGIPAFFWWVAAADFLPLRTPASTAALVPGYRRTYTIVVVLHFVLTCVAPAALLAAKGADFGAVFGPMLVCAGAGALVGQRAGWLNGGLLVLCILVFIQNEGDAGAESVTRVLQLGFGVLFFTRWWVLGLGARPEARWNDWMASILRLRSYEESVRHAGTVDDGLLAPFARLERRLYEALEAWRLRRFAAAPAPRARRADMLDVGLSRLAPRALSSAATTVLVLIPVLLPASAGFGAMIVLMLLPLSHGMICTTVSGWHSAQLREPELLSLLPRLDPERRLGALAAGVIVAQHARLFVMHVLAWLATAALFDLAPTAIVCGLLWFAIVATWTAAFSCAVLATLHWSRLLSGFVAYAGLVVAAIVAALRVVGDPPPGTAWMLAAILLAGTAALALARRPLAAARYPFGA